MPGPILLATRSAGKLRELRPFFSEHGYRTIDLVEAGLHVKRRIRGPRGREQGLRLGRVAMQEDQRAGALDGIDLFEFD